MKMLLIGFGALGEAKLGSTYEAVKAVEAPEGVEIMKLKVPMIFGQSLELVHHTLRAGNFDVVLGIGQYGGETKILFDRFAVNLDDAEIQDADGSQPIDEPIFSDGDTAYFSSLPIKAMTREARRAGVPADVSGTADLFLYNHLMYGILYYLHKEFPQARGGFLHIPFFPAQVADMPKARPSMSVETVARGIEAAIRAILDNPEEDIKINTKVYFRRKREDNSLLADR